MAIAVEKMTAVFRKVSVEMYADDRFLALSPMQPSGRSLWLHLITGPHTCPVPGLSKIGRAAMAEELGWEAKAFDEAFAEVFRQGLAKANWEARVIWLPRAIKHNLPQSPNVVTSWARHWASIPDCDLKTEAWEALRGEIKSHGNSFLEAFDKACPKPSSKAIGKAFDKACPKPIDNQEQEKEQEKKKEPPSLRSGAAAPELSDEEEFWQILVPKLEAIGIARSRPAQIAKMTGDFARASQILREVLKAKSPDPYIGGVLKRLREDTAADASVVAPVKPKKGEPNPPPEWVQEVRALGSRVEWLEPGRWRDCDGDIVDDLRSVQSG